jgi:hypothetical protein
VIELQRSITFLCLFTFISGYACAEGAGNAADMSTWQSYTNAESGFSFRYPKGWEVVDDFFYKTGYVATIQRVGSSEDANNWIRINSPQFQIGDGKCIDVDKQHICTYSKDTKVSGILEMLATSFRVRSKSVTNADFFFYSCVHEYMKAHSIKIFDGSMAYAVEYMDAPAETIMTLHKAAKDYALTIRAPDYSDPEHGLPAVFVLCQDKAKGYGGAASSNAEQ